MKNTQWYLDQADKITKVRVKLHQARLQVDKEYKHRNMMALLKFLAFPATLLLKAIIKKKQSGQKPRC